MGFTTLPTFYLPTAGDPGKVGGYPHPFLVVY